MRFKIHETFCNSNLDRETARANAPSSILHPVHSCVFVVFCLFVLCLVFQLAMQQQQSQSDLILTDRQLVAAASVTRFGEMLPKCHCVFGKCLRVYLIFVQNVEPSLETSQCYWTHFRCCYKWANVEKLYWYLVTLAAAEAGAGKDNKTERRKRDKAKLAFAAKYSLGSAGIGLSPARMRQNRNAMDGHTFSW